MIKQFKRALCKFTSRFKYFLNNSNLHGIRYLGDRCQRIGKIAWLIVLVVSVVGMIKIFHLTFINFREESININIDTAYLHWTNLYPAISVCLARGSSIRSIQEFMTEYWRTNENISKPIYEVKYFKMIHKYLFVTPDQSIDENDYCWNLNSTCGINVEMLQRMFLPQHCSDFMFNVSYMGRSFDNCGDIFKLQKTEMGLCFTANSIYDYDQDVQKLPLTYDRADYDRTFSFFYNDVDLIRFALYVHSPEEPPYFDGLSRSLVAKSAQLQIKLNTIEMKNGQDVQYEPIEYRNCRFLHEKLPDSVLPYSFSSCFTNLRIHLELEICNCTLQTSPIEYKHQYCDYKGLVCISNALITEKIKEKQYTKETACLQSCIEMEINVVGGWVDVIQSEYSFVAIDVLNVPTLRYVRNVAKTKLDLVVAIGGVAGLFFGASVLSLAEVLYIWCLRQF